MLVGNTSENKGLIFTVLLRLFSARIRREGEERRSSERGKKRASDLDFTNVFYRRNIGAVTVLFFISRLCLDLADQLRYPKADELDIAFCFCFFEKTRDVNESRVQ